MPAYAHMLSIGAHLFHEDFRQSFPLEVGFVPMMHPTEAGRIFIAEKTTFSSLTDFLRTEFHRAWPLATRQGAATTADGTFS